MTYEEKKNYYDITFDSAIDFLTWINEPKNDNKMKEEMNDCGKGEYFNIYNELFNLSLKNEFFGKSNPDKVISDMEKPEQKLEKLFDFSNEILLANDDLICHKQNKRRIHRRLSDGDEIDVDRYIEREFDSMFETMQRDGENEVPFISLHVGVQVNCSWNDRHFFWRTATVYTILSIIEELGMNSEVIAENIIDNPFTSEDGKPNKIKLQFTAKKLGEPIDPVALSYILGSKAFSRISSLGVVWESASRLCGHRYVASGSGRPRIENKKYTGNEYFVNTYQDFFCNETIARSEINKFVEFIEGKLHM